MQHQAPLFEEHHTPLPFLLNTARLMEPDEVLSSLGSRLSDVDKVRGHWFLCGDITDRFYQLARDRSDLITFRISAFYMPGHLSYCIITHQLEDAQHRFLMPLYEVKMAKCLRQAFETPLAFSLGHDSSNQAVIQMPSRLASLLTPLLSLHMPLTQERALLAVDQFPEVLAAACEFDQVPTLLAGCEVKEVSVSALFPEEAIVMVSKGNQ